MDDFRLDIRANLIFQQDEAPAHCNANNLCNYRKKNFQIDGQGLTDQFGMAA